MARSRHVRKLPTRATTWRRSSDSGQATRFAKAHGRAVTRTTGSMRQQPGALSGRQARGFYPRGQGLGPVAHTPKAEQARDGGEA